MARSTSFRPEGRKGEAFTQGSGYRARPQGEWRSIGKQGGDSTQQEKEPMEGER